MNQQIFFFVLIILIVSIIYGSKDMKIENFNPYLYEPYKRKGLDSYLACQKKALQKCQIPTVPSSTCFMTQYYRCPKYNGSYDQCTNNYASLDQICECENRGFLECPYPYKLSEKCYQEELQNCKMPKTIKKTPCRNPRINIWHSDIYDRRLRPKPILY